ncbi:hypothetical protein NLM31_12845 [Bradyrhizobium sp. CCGUVB4N]|uniref:hypothetical protein n=1 Tax=Bradyrhizobium sp. CCGUVB4N TaxID=2949631 RepID=UPI0020B36BE9|nr:hypothetical protein [Bradyrhizobium sp. CCGUVB4N]MCP3381228.1 hypothetical protein [Bradyrhizobium sp. CCGUVB4N]
MSSFTRAVNIGLFVVLSVRALFYFAIGGLMLAFAAWLVLPSGSSWVLDVIAALIGWKGLEVVGMGLEQFAAHADRNRQMVAAAHAHRQQGLPMRRERGFDPRHHR